MKPDTNLNNLVGLLKLEEILKRHLADTRRDIQRACIAIALHAPGIHTSPDIDIDIDGMGGVASPSRGHIILPCGTIVDGTIVGRRGRTIVVDVL